MKKNFFFLLLLGFLFSPFNSYALSFTDCNNIEHNVNDYESLRDYCYFNYYDNSSSSLFVFTNNTCVEHIPPVDAHICGKENGAIYAKP